MQLMEEAAGVAATRYFNHKANCRIAALLSRVERLSFQHPVHVGDVAQVNAKVVFASRSSVAVCVQVTAERMAWSISTTGSSDTDTVVCNRALMWLVGNIVPTPANLASPLRPSFLESINPKDYIRAVAPPFPKPLSSDTEAWQSYQQAAELYQESQTKCDNISSSSGDMGATNDRDANNQTAHISFAKNTMRRNNPPQSTQTTGDATAAVISFTPDHSSVELVQVMQPSDCVNSTGLVAGGVVMKLMDNACGVVAVRHCGTNTVTVSVNCVNLIAPVLLGDVLKVQARPVFTSKKSIEILVSVVAERFLIDESDGSLMRQEVVTTEQAYFTFVALPLLVNSSSGDNDGDNLISSLPMRQLVLETDLDKALYAERKAKYRQRKETISRVQAKL